MVVVQWGGTVRGSSGRVTVGVVQWGGTVRGSSGRVTVGVVQWGGTLGVLQWVYYSGCGTVGGTVRGSGGCGTVELVQWGWYSGDDIVGVVQCAW